MPRPTAYRLALVLFAALVLLKFSPQTGFTSLIRFGETWQDRRHSALQNLPIATVPNSNGYDGQFYAQIAIDPLLRGSELERAIDAPAYRARRILAPAAAALLGLGNPWWTLQAYALLNVICWFALARLLYDCIDSPHNWVGFARWAGCIFSVGVLDSVRQSLVDLPAMLLLSFAIHSYAQARTAKTALWLALSNLTRETGLLGTIALNGTELFGKPRRWSAVVIIFVAAALPALWSLYVNQRFSGTSTYEGFVSFSWPMFGIFSETKLCLRELLHGNFDGRYSFGLLAIGGLLTQAITLWRAPDLQSAWWRVGAAYSSLLPFIGVVIWSGYWAVCRYELPMTIAFNLLLPRGRSFWPLWIVGNLTLLHGLWRFL